MRPPGQAPVVLLMVYETPTVHPAARAHTLNSQRELLFLIFR